MAKLKREYPLGFYMAFRNKARKRLQKEGVSFLASWDMTNKMTDAVIDEQLKVAFTLLTVNFGTQKLGDGKIIAFFEKIWESPQGQAIFEVLFQLLMAWLGGLKV